MSRIHISNGKRRKIYNKQNGICSICGQKIQYMYCTIDHVISISKGGSKTDINNMEVTCYICNYMKSDLYKKDFLEHIERIYKYSINKTK